MIRRPAPGWPHPPVVLLAMAGVAVVVVAVIEVRAVGYAFTLTGLSPGWAAGVLAASLLGSGVNLPVAHVGSDQTEIDYVPVRRWGVVYLVPVGRPGRTTIAVNVGGAVVPALVSAYLVVHGGLWAPAAAAVAVVAAVVHLTARPVTSLGVVVPVFVPPIAAAGVALLIGTSGDVASVAYVAGTLGTLIGADLANARSFRRLQARVLSIGGGGTFDGVFVAGVLAVLLAAFV